ncbi:MAG: type II toxin-antitoxin system Phd/YefM family antitoxin [Acidobacteria bacterium]|nr:type II toxin-antitoxin system Phd/YefM family antitoxin [Acidobacteriota bacterium]
MPTEVMQVNVHEAKTHLSQLLARVAAGEEIVISKAGRPVARLVPFRDAGRPRLLGQDQHLSHYIAPDFDAPLPAEMLDAFDGEAK